MSEDFEDIFDFNRREEKNKALKKKNYVAILLDRSGSM